MQTVKPIESYHVHEPDWRMTGDTYMELLRLSRNVLHPKIFGVRVSAVLRNSNAYRTRYTLLDDHTLTAVELMIVGYIRKLPIRPVKTSASDLLFLFDKGYRSLRILVEDILVADRIVKKLILRYNIMLSAQYLVF